MSEVKKINKYHFNYLDEKKNKTKKIINEFHLREMIFKISRECN